MFSRDCLSVDVAVAKGRTLTVLVNHFKSKIGGGADKRERQAARVLEIAQARFGKKLDGGDLVVAGDPALFAMPLSYTHPELAKEELELLMGLAFAKDSRFSYAFQGHGMLDDALGIHSAPSDLDLFFLLAMIEYLGATGDMAFLDEPISYYPISKENEATTFDHVRRAVSHLFTDVGLSLIHI